MKKKDILLILFAIICCCLIVLFRPVFVQGCSMQPTLKQDDMVICNTLNKNPKIGDIVIIKPLICFGDDYVIKRVTDIQEDKIFIEGDNKDHSFDSRNVGWIDKSNIFGTILFM